MATLKKPYVVRSNNQEWLKEINDDYTRLMGYYTELTEGQLKVFPSHPPKEKKKKEDDDEGD